MAWAESQVLALQSVKDHQEEMQDRMESDGKVEIDLEFEKQMEAW